MGIDATRKWPAEGMTKEWPKRLVTTEAAAKKADALWERIRNRDVKR
jgi:4-hydroxy-3-polyprenylbenzoate decarboxylase